MPSKTVFDSNWSSNIFEKPKGWPYNAVLLFAAALSFFLMYTRETGAWMTLGFIFIVFAIGESIPSERTSLAGAIRVGGLGLVVLVAVIIDFGLK
ncbi:hypothetical protein B1756_13455 [Natrarchaeobaculum aegyptiacum]|uniref:Uncharacterized protein n=1 Tax=Natrarchaeobaculum aegyptiacum TaxID=745377 RepID=A0A2Z2HY48_9EURY|nr:hypothetical protein B1756_13455 [Natrarchaeobaculum aegyptiacum]